MLEDKLGGSGGDALFNFLTKLGSRTSLGEAVTFAAVELGKSSRKSTAQTLDIVCVINICRGMPQSLSVLLDGLFPAPLRQCLCQPCPHPGDGGLV